jgi:DNA repair protein RadC
MKNSVKIKCLEHEDRPREKLLDKGAAALTEVELLAIMIGSGYEEKSAIELAREILSAYGPKLHQISKMEIGEWLQIKGIGEGKAATLMACFELGRRRRLETALNLKRVECSKDAFEFLLPHLGDLRHEEFWVLLLNRGNNVIAVKKISEGGLAYTSVDPKRIFTVALQHHSNSVVLAHNHPSGNLKPSDDDRRITRKLQAVGVELELSVVDHLIISGNVYFSFADEGLL